MKKVILIPDSFKGSISSSEICGIMEKSIKKYFPSTQVISLPVADGGEGSVDAFLQAIGGNRIEIEVSGPYGKPINSFYGVLKNSTAIVEMAAAAGLPLVGENKSAAKTTTYGVGELINHAVEAGYKKIVVGLGGSCTTDGGCGAAAAMGAVFKDSNGNEFVPTGETLSKIHSIDTSEISRRLSGVEIVSMCDIDNPLCGLTGAAHVFGPQKGADEEEVNLLDKGLENLAEVVKRDLKLDIKNLPGSGAAGGMGGGMVAFFESELKMGIEVVLDTVEFDSLLEGTDMVFTGEGKIDSQSLRGKVVIGVARHTKKFNVPLVAIVGDIEDPIDKAYDMGVSAVFSTNRLAKPFSEVKAFSKRNMELTMDNIMRYHKILLK